MRTMFFKTGLLMAVGLLFMPRDVQAQNLSLDPTDYDYGDVVVDTSEPKTFTITSTEGVHLVIYAILIWDDSTGSFEITSDLPAFPYLMLQDETLDFEVTFTPAFEAELEGSFIISSNAVPPDDFLEVSVSGTGVTAEPPPVCLTLDDVLVYFDAAADAGTLLGSGPGGSADNRLNALRNMIVEAGYLLDAGEVDLAYEQLLDAFYRCDGEFPPPDFVGGEGAAGLNDLLLILLTDPCM